MSILVSICIPTRSERRLAYLREAVASALAQTHKDLEVLVSDDAGEESIREFVLEQMRLDPRVRYRRNEIPLGLGGNCNALIGWAGGEYLVIMGDDDRLLPKFVEEMLAARIPEAVVIFANHHVINEKGNRNDKLTREFTTLYGRDRLASGEVSDPAASVWRNSVPMSASLIRAADAKRLGMKKDLNTPDIEIFARIAAEAKLFVFVPQFLAEYRVHPLSQTSAGLATGRLIKYLDPIHVPAHVELLKRKFMTRLLMSAVSSALREGDIQGARVMLQHRYYPFMRERPVGVLAHKVIAAMPKRVAKVGATCVVRVRQAVRTARSR